MNSLDTYGKIGGWDWKWDDIEFVQSAFIEALTGFGSSVGNCVLSGCELANNDTENTAGFIYHDGLVVYLASGVITSEGNPVAPTFYYKLVTTYDASGSRTTKLGTNIEIYKVLRVKVVIAEAGIAGGNYIDFDSLKSFNDQLAVNIQNSVISLRQNITGADFTAIQLNGWSCAVLRATKSYDGIVTINGMIDGTSATGAVVLNLPVNFRPITVIRGSLWPTSASGSAERFEINTSGNINTITGQQLEINVTYPTL